jgi:uncharacterized damage-inducible protein DinB
MTTDDLRGLLDYHYWARDRLLNAVEPLAPEQFTRDLGSSFKSIRDTVAHIYGAEWIWHERWRGRAPAALPRADQFDNVAALRSGWSDLERNVRGFVDGLPDRDVGRVFEYQMLSGKPASSPFWQMVHHVVNHASYHRGQVTTMLRQLGAAPPQSLDAIAFYFNA